MVAPLPLAAEAQSIRSPSSYDVLRFDGFWLVNGMIMCKPGIIILIVMLGQSLLQCKFA